MAEENKAGEKARKQTSVGRAWLEQRQTRRGGKKGTKTNVGK